jgi:ribonucleoside-diphosphate reductase alpha chain
MAAMRVDHPDIMEFIKCKEQEGMLANFNISVFITDEFMKAVKNNKTIKLYHEKYDKTHSMKAREIWKALTERAWKNGEPGIIFWDELNRGDVFKGNFGKLGVNPCGEQPLLEYESCNLAAINLAQCYDENEGTVDLDKVEHFTRLGIHFLDNIIDINNFPLKSIEEWTTKTRRVGLGTMGLHDLLLKLQIRYGSEDSITLIDSMYNRIAKAANAESEKLGAERGIPDALKEIGLNRRNSGLITVQPTGTISMICNQASSGIEPVFQWAYTRKDKYGTHDIQHFLLEEYGEDSLPSYAVTALDLKPEDHVNVQATIQKHVDSSISKTCNLPNKATVEDIDQIYKYAYSLKCKSITVYRSGSRQEEVLIKNKDKEKEEQPKPIIRERPRVLYGATYRMNTPGGKAYITVNEDPEGIREVFIHISKAGSEIGTHIEAEGRLISNSLKHRIPVEDVIEHLTDHKSNPIIDHGKIIKSVPDAVAKVVREFREKIEGFSEFLEESDSVPSIYDEQTDFEGEISGELCPDCGEVMYTISNCNECRSCGYSQCG